MVLSAESFDGELMSRNTPLAEIAGGRLVRVLDMARLPFHFSHARDPSLGSWLRQRAVDPSRTHFRFLCRAAGFSDASLEGIVLSVSAACITDTYWLREAGSRLTYEEVRFRRNDLCRAALLGSHAGCPAPQGPSPEWTNPGRFEKCWCLEEGRWRLYKRGRAENTAAELVCRELGSRLGLRMALYEPVTRQEAERLFDCRAPISFSAVKSPDFTDGAAVNLEPAADLGCRWGEVEDNYRILRAFSSRAAEEYRKMAALDAFACNPDRHPCNFGVLRRVETGEVLSLAPVYDQNLALFPALEQRSGGLDADPLLAAWARLEEGGEAETFLPVKWEELAAFVDEKAFPEPLRETGKEIAGALAGRGRWMDRLLEKKPRRRTLW